MQFPRWGVEPGFSLLPGFQRICSSALNEHWHLSSPSLLGLAWPSPGVRSQEPGLRYPLWKVLAVPTLEGFCSTHSGRFSSSFLAPLTLTSIISAVLCQICDHPLAQHRGLSPW